MGPAAYYADKPRKNDHKWIIGKRLIDNSLEERKRMPGPQNYDPYKPSGSPNYKIGTGRRVSHDDVNKTGPGDYSPERHMHSSMK
jgi:hypothetical protein